MKVTIATVLVILAGSSALAQGSINFNNRATAYGLNAPITFTETGTGPGPGYSAGLFHNGALLPTSLTTFREPSPLNPVTSQYIQPVRAYVPGTTPGQLNVIVEMRVWPTSAGTYDLTPEAQRGTSGPLTVAQLGTGGAPDWIDHLPPSFQGFQVSIPEPRTVWLAILAGSVAATCRCRGAWAASSRSLR